MHSNYCQWYYYRCVQKDTLTPTRTLSTENNNIIINSNTITNNSNIYTITSNIMGSHRIPASKSYHEILSSEELIRSEI